MQALGRSLPKDSPLQTTINECVQMYLCGKKASVEYRSRSCTHMLTYQGDWGFIEDVSEQIHAIVDAPRKALEMDLDYDHRRIELATKMLLPMPNFDRLREQFLEKLRTIVRCKYVEHWALTLEICPHALLHELSLHVHAHVYVSRKDKFDLPLRDCVVLGTTPHRSLGILTITQCRSSRNFSGLYYTVAPKVGTLTVDTNCNAFTGFPVVPQWILTMLQSQKMTYAIAREQLIRCARDVVRTTGIVDKWRQELQAAFMKEHEETVQEHLELHRRSFVSIPEVNDWCEDHKVVRFRYKFLVLNGESGLGKTQYALGLVPRGRSLELNMAATDTPDLKLYDPVLHDLILFDEMKAQDVLLHKKLFQAPASMLSMGNSATNCHAYTRWLHQKLLVVSTNRWNVELEQLKSVDVEWLKANAVVIQIHAPLWVVEDASEEKPQA